MRTFALYPVEQHWWSFHDYGAVLDVMAQLEPKHVLEFGPGSSTLALIEGGAVTVDACEDDPIYVDRAKINLVDRFPEIVRLRPYTWSDDVSVPGVDGRLFDLALVDGPRITERRPAVVRYAIAHARAVLLPTEDAGAIDRSYLRPRILALAKEFGLQVDIRETGPLSGSFALLTKC